MEDVLDKILGIHITKAALKLPDAATASNEPHYVNLSLKRRKVLIVFRRAQARARWFWTAESAVVLDE